MADEQTSLWDAASDPDRKRGFLTKRDREYIIGEIDVEGQKERDLRYRIRNRVKNGLFDMVVLDTYPDDELEKILSSADYPPDNLIVHLYTIAYRLLSRSYGSTLAAGAVFEDLSDIMENMLKHSIEREERYREGVVEVDIEIQISRSDFDEDLILNKILAGNATTEEFWTYEKRGDIERLISRVEAEGKEDEMFFNLDYLKNQLEKDD